MTFDSKPSSEDKPESFAFADDKIIADEAALRRVYPKLSKPIREKDAFLLPQSEVIMHYLEQLYPEPQLLPADQSARAQVRLAL